MSEKCSTYGREGKYIKIFVVNLKGRYNLKDLGANGKILFE
jgi:hypothetical protein